MNQEENDRKHLTPRQIINRYRKGEYVDEGIEAISSAVSSCAQPFDSVAMPFPETLVEKIFQNIGIARVLYERRKEGRSTDDVEVPDYPQLRDFLMDLSIPDLWESMQEGREDNAYFDILDQHGLRNKYTLDGGKSKINKVASFYLSSYRESIRQTGLSYTIFELVLYLMAC